MSNCLDLFNTPMALITCSRQTCNDSVHFCTEIRKISCCCSLSLGRTWSFHVIVLQRTAKKCTKISNKRSQLLFSSLNLLLGDVLVAVVVVVCLNSLVDMAARLLWRSARFTVLTSLALSKKKKQTRGKKQTNKQTSMDRLI